MSSYYAGYCGSGLRLSEEEYDALRQNISNLII